MSIAAANRECLKRLNESTSKLVDIRRALDVIPGMTDRSVFHAGPPVAWDNMCGPMKGAIAGACLFEGWARSLEEAETLAGSGALHFDSLHNHRACGPMSGVTTPSMMVNVIRNETAGIETCCNLYEGIGKVLRHGANTPDVLERLRWMNTKLAALLKTAIHRSGGIDIKNIVAQAVQMGDEMHNRNKASNALLTLALAPHLVAVAKSPEDAVRAITFIDASGHFILNSVMPSCKAMLDAGAGIPDSTIVTTIARNGTEVGIRVSGTGGQWFTAAAPKIEGVYFPGFGPDDANPDIGDSAITETMGLGSCAMAAAPAIVQYVGGTPQKAVETTMRSYEITAGEHDTFKIPALNFRGTPLGIDIRKVVETGFTPVINTGIACRRPGVGQIGAGITAVPMECFEKALEAFVAARTKATLPA
jgi:hypothetical protein